MTFAKIVRIDVLIPILNWGYLSCQQYEEDAIKCLLLAIMNLYRFQEVIY